MKLYVAIADNEWSMSHPAGVRGLKLPGDTLWGIATKSHPAGVRGLKRV